MAKDNKRMPDWSDFTPKDDDLLDDDTNLEDDKDPDEDPIDEPQDKKKDKKKVVDDKKQKKQPPKVSDDDDEPADDDDEDSADVIDDTDKGKDKKKVEKVQPKDDDDSDDDDSDDGVEVAEKFFEEVERITGTSVEVDYGDVDPLSPQGVALREKAIKEVALDSFLEEIEAKFPQAFKALQHAYNGGDIAELFTQTTGRDYSKVELKDGDDTLAKEILKEYYKSRGVKSESKINKMIEADEDSENGLIKEAQVALNELKEEQEEQTSKALEVQKQKAAETKKKDQILVAAVDEVLEARKLGNFRISDRQEAIEFKKFILGSIRRTNDGNYELATPVAAGNLEKQLQYFYFQFKQGDLSKIVQQKAATQNAKKLQLKLQNEQSKTKRSTQQDDNTKLSLRDFSR